MLPDNCKVPTNTANSVIKPFCLSHGTLECYKLDDSRKFYEEFLGFEVVRHGITSMALRMAMRFHIICVEVGSQLKPVNLLNHWGVDVASRKEVDDAYQNAIKLQDYYKIRKVMPPQDQHGVYSFYLIDLDHNWWEVQFYENGFLHDDYFDFGDRFSMTDSRTLTKADDIKTGKELAS